MALELPSDMRGPKPANHRLAETLALLAPIEVTQASADWAFVEQAKAKLMLAYDIDADNALELLRWGSQACAVTLDELARRLGEDLAGLGAGDVESIRSVCDDALFPG